MNSCKKKSKSKSKYGVFGRQETKLDYGKRNQKTLRPGKARDASEREGENASAETEEERARAEQSHLHASPAGRPQTDNCIHPTTSNDIHRLWIYGNVQLPPSWMTSA